MPEKTQKNYFSELKKVDVSKYVDKRESGKNELSYLSWSFAYDQMMQYDPSATWRIAEFDENGVELPEGQHGKPYQDLTPFGYMVKTYVTVAGVEKSMFLPVMDSHMCAVKDHPYNVKTKYSEFTVNPGDANTINKSILRCFVKTLALFGLGINLYQGEDLPVDEGLVTKTGEVITGLADLPETANNDAPKPEEAKVESTVVEISVETPEVQPEIKSEKVKEAKTPTNAGPLMTLEEVIDYKVKSPGRFNGKALVKDFIESSKTKANKNAVLKQFENLAARAPEADDMKACQSVLHYLETGELKFADSCN